MFTNTGGRAEVTTENRIVSGMWVDDAWAGPLREAQRRAHLCSLAREWDDILQRFGELGNAREGRARWRGASNSRANEQEIEMMATAQRIQNRLWNLCQ